MPYENYALGLYEALEGLANKIKNAPANEKYNYRNACTVLQMEIISFESERQFEIDSIMSRVKQLLEEAN